MSSTPPFETFLPTTGLSQTPPPWIRLWALIAVVSPTSEIACQVVLGSVPGWLIWLRISVLVVVAAAGARWTSLAVLRPFALAELLQAGCIAGRDIVQTTRLYRLMEARGFGWSELFLASLSFVIIGPVLVWCWRRRDQFFLHIGNLSEPLRPLRVHWSVVAPVFALGAALCAWGFVGLTGAPAPNSWAMVPTAVMLAAINAFQEEFIYRNVIAGAVRVNFGAVQAVAVSAFIFGIGHWNGLPAGVPGVLMTLTLGVVTGMAMVQTKGIFWSWFMHFVPDCVLFYYWSVGSVAHATIGTGHL
ncbi:MAG TPA: CPBP family intramembrane glutamic endopeptidase [Bryobacteraceae bacterium]|nr:CPBP family intramembrane glutamic endopeptidase [Bryobacteraceae bacterium]